MKFSVSIQATLRKSFDFSGRSTRSEFWQFFPLGLALPVISSLVAFEVKLSFWSILIVCMATSIPLMAVGARRLQDTGHLGSDAVAPWLYAIGAAVFFKFSRDLDNALHYAFSGIDVPDGPGGLGFVVLYGGGKWILLISALVCSAIFIINITPAFGQCLVNSQPKTNKFGPNPLEVSQ